MTPIRDNRNSERPHFCLITGFRDIHPPDRGRLMRAHRGVHPHRHLGPCLAGQRDQPIDPCRLAARIALRDLAHAYQRVMPAAQHQLLQVHGRGHVPFLHRLEDPASQPPYLLLAAPPVHMLPGVAVESREYRPGVLRSVHRGVQLILWFRHLLPFRFKGSPAHVSVLSDPSAGPVSGQLYKDHPGGVPGPAAPDFLLPFSCRHSLFEHPVLPGNSAPLTVGLPHRLRIPAPEMRTHGTVSTFRTRETQTGPGALCTPGTAVLTGHAPSAAAACRLSTAGPCHPGDTTQPGV